MKTPPAPEVKSESARIEPPKHRRGETPHCGPIRFSRHPRRRRLPPPAPRRLPERGSGRRLCPVCCAPPQRQRPPCGHSPPIAPTGPRRRSPIEPSERDFQPGFALSFLERYLE